MLFRAKEKNKERPEGIGYDGRGSHFYIGWSRKT